MSRALDELKVSDGTGEAVIANIESDRAISAITLDVDSVDNWPNKMILATGDKVLASNGSYYIDPSTMTIMYGHLDSGDIVIDGYAPGYTDDGNTSGQIAIIKPNTYAQDELVRLVGEGNPVGRVVDYAGSTAPTGWLFCYGQTLDASTDEEYQALFDVIGNVYGGSNNTDFVVPDLRGRVIAGQDDMGGVSADRMTTPIDGDVLGASGGTEGHTHVLSSSGWAKINNAAGKAARMLRVAATAFMTNASATGTEGGDSYSSTGGAGLGGETDSGSSVQPTMVLNKIIKY